MNNSNHFKTNSGKILPYAVYNEQDILDFKGNPLIEALPEIHSFEEAYTNLSYIPEFHPQERQLPIHKRYQALLRLTRFYQPLNQTLELEYRFSRFLRYGYVSRNPYHKEHTMMLNNLNGLLEAKQPLYLKPDIRNTSSSFTLIGFSGIGKTSAIERILSLYPQTFIHKYPLNLIQIVWIKLNTPHDGSIKTLCMDFFLKVDELIGTNYFEKYGNRRNSNSSMVVRIAQVARIHCIGTIIIDEVQHLLSGKKIQSDELMNFFVTLINEIGIPVMLIGTMKAKNILQKDFRQARRSSGHGDMVWEQMKNDDNWEVLITSMWQFQWIKQPEPISKEWIDLMHKESQGIIDIAVKLFLLSQSYSIEHGYETLTFPMFKKVKKEYLKLVQPMLDALESGNISRINKFEDITPINIVDHINKKMPLINMKKKLEEIKEIQQHKQLLNQKSILNQAVESLVGLEISFEHAKAISEKIIKENQSLSVKEIVLSALKQIDLNEQQVEDKQKKVLPKNHKKINNRLQREVIKGRNHQKTARISLIEANIITNVLEELSL